MIRDAAPVRKVLIVLVCFLIIADLDGSFEKRCWLNLTDSEPIGLYRVEKFNGEIKRGDMVLMSVPEQFRQYVYGRKWLPEGWPLFKHVGAVPGDLYCFGNSAFTINGAQVGPVYPADGKGLPLPRLEGCRQVPDRHFLPVAVRIKTSFDGRYMGAVSVSEIRGLAKPILTF